MIFRHILNLLFPPRCASCKREGDFLCSLCFSKLDIKTIRHRSRLPSAKDFTYLDGVIYSLDYAENPGIKAALQQFKYKFTKELVDTFGTLVTTKLGELGMVRDKEIILVPVPLHKKRLHYRGFNQAVLIAETIKMRLGEKVKVLSVLKRIKNTSQQAKLKRSERQKNLENAFECTSDPSLFNDQICFVVDDVCTTGATLDSCAWTLKKKGLKKVYGLVVARAFK